MVSCGLKQRWLYRGSIHVLLTKHRKLKLINSATIVKRCKITWDTSSNSLMIKKHTHRQLLFTFTTISTIFTRLTGVFKCMFNISAQWYPEIMNWLYIWLWYMCLPCFIIHQIVDYETIKKLLLQCTKTQRVIKNHL